MKQSIKTFLLFLTIFIITRPIIALENNPETNKETNEKVSEDAKKTSEENIQEADTKQDLGAGNKDENSVTKQKTATPLTGKENASEPNKKNKSGNNIQTEKKSARTVNANETILKNPSLSEEFRESYGETNPMEHTLINFFYGALSGGIIGLGGGLSFYTTSTDLTPLFISAGAVGAVGGITGVVLALIESANKNEFQLSAGLFQYAWYGVFGGALIGGIAGLIPYSTTNDLASLLNWVGYGTFAGLGIGIAMYFIFPKQSFKNLIIDTNPLEPKIGYRFYF